MHGVASSNLQSHARNVFSAPVFRLICRFPNGCNGTPVCCRVLRNRLMQAGAQGRDVKQLDASVEDARKEAAERSLFEKQVVKSQLDSENRVLWQRLSNQKGRDRKALDADVEEARSAAGS